MWLAGFSFSRSFWMNKKICDPRISWPKQSSEEVRPNFTKNISRSEHIGTFCGLFKTRSVLSSSTVNYLSPIGVLKTWEKETAIEIKFIYFRNNQDENTPPVSFILWLRFRVLSFLEFSIHLTFLYAGVKVLHVLSRYIEAVWLLR